MTDFNASVLQPQNKTVSFCAFEKERWKKIWRFVRGKKIDESSDIGVFQLAWKVYGKMQKSARKVFYKLLAFHVAGGFIDGIMPYLNMLVYGSLPAVLTGSKKAIYVFIGFLILHVFCSCMLTICFRMARVLYAKKMENIMYNFNNAIRYKEIIQKPRTFFVVNTEETACRLANTIAYSEINLLRWFADFVNEAIVIVTLSISLFLHTPFLAFCIIVLSLFDVEQQSYLQAYWRRFNHKNRLFGLRTGQINRDILRNTPLIQDGLTSDYECKRIKHRLDHCSNNLMKVISASMRLELWRDVLLRFFTYGVAGVFAIIDIIKTGDIGRFALITGGAYQLLQTIERFTTEYQEWLVKERNTIVDTQKQLVTPKALIRKCGDKKLNQNDNKIVLKNVEFAYPKIKDATKINDDKGEIERGEEVLHNVSLEIKKGGVTVIAGMSGHGKSTLMSLIRHDYDVTGGEVLLGGVNVQDLSDEAINKQIAFVDQNVHFFDNTLLYNVKYFNQNASDEKVQNALEVAGLTNDIARFKDGVFHKIGQDGRALSGGQRQRLALARTFLADRPIVIMDEPTTGLDQVLSFKVMRVLQKLAKNKTVLLVTHNPTEIALADRVLIVQEGKIVADGSPLELIESSSFLSSAMTKQDILSKQKLFNKH